MKLLRISVIVFLAANLADLAWAQYGLYGSPDTLQMQQQVQQQPTAVPYNGYQASYGGQAAGVPVAYSQQVAPYSAPNGYVAQQTPYPAPSGYPTQQAIQPVAPQPAAANPAAAQAYRTAYNPRPAYIAQQAAQPISPAPTTTQTVPDPMPAWDEPASKANTGVTGQMLNEQAQTGNAGGNNYVPSNSACGPCRSGVNQYEEAACEVDCGYLACPWYASISGLALSRNDANRVWTSYETGNEPNQLMNTQDARSGWKFGGEVRFGRRFCATGCDPCSPAGYWALEASYWTIDPFEGEASISSPNTVSTPLRVSDIEFRDMNGLNQPGTYWFDTAAEHRLWRHNEIHSLEINLVRGQWANVCGSNWDFAFSIGPRFFRFEESLRFGSVRDGYAWAEDGGAWAAYLDDRITNNLWGGQVGLDLGYNFGSGALRLFVTPKVGAYNNSIDNYFQANLGNGTVATTGSSGVPGTYPVSSSANTFAVMSQIDTGVEWFFARRWSARVGYRVLAISGIGLADNQIPPYIVDIPEIADIDTNGDLILHGGFATLTFNF